MVSKRLKIKAKSEGTLVLDAQGLSLHVDGDEGMRARIEVAQQSGRRVALSALTPLEVRRTGEAAKRLRFLLSRFDVKPVNDAVTDAAAKLLDTSGLDGHECLVDALVVATAALCPPPVLLVTSDKSHIPALCKAAEELPGSPKVKIVNV
ncbi:MULTISPECIES: DNA-binding protein [unclassified Streptomyces]|uniref:DNA-binding protein n=1 Tax=unclassified Streptomyces TaxID=2593676 RepID=UPI002E10B988|nr:MULTISPECIES: DNA-binding protein [unclassified Streptomyces]WSR27469.1 DNA-binding protein [Streptomyces sp. NBC_01205]